jgi:hypothetical protein
LEEALQLARESEIIPEVRLIEEIISRTTIN